MSAASLGSPEDDVEGAGERVRLLLRSRPQGHDPPFLAMAEEEGKRRGCAVIALFTPHFQAPGFYQKQGYEVAATLENATARRDPRPHEKANSSR